MQVHFICLQWKHFNISKFKSMCLDPSISWIFEAGRMASVRQGKCLPSILYLFCLNCVFPESPEKGANASYFFSLFFQLYRVPPGHNSFLVSFPFLPSALGLVSFGGKHPQSPSEAKSCRCFSPLRTWPEAGHSASLPAPGCTAGRGAKLLLLPHLCKRDVFWPYQLYKRQEELGE